MKFKIILLFFFVLFGSLAIANDQGSFQDTVPFDNPDYIGYRMAIADLSVTPLKNGKSLKVNYKIINTGRKDLLFGKKITSPPSLVINFDHTLLSSGLIDFAQEIRDAILQSEFNISAGKISDTRNIKIPVSSGKQIKMPDTEEIERTEEVQTSIAISTSDTNKKVIEPVGSSSERSVDENACSDLSIESIKIVRKSKKSVTLEYTIINNGVGPAQLINNPKKEKLNMALKAHLSTKNQLTKGSLPFGGTYLKNGLANSKGKLYPGEKFTSTIKLSTQKMTDFTPYIVLELDPYMAVHECDKKNNKGAIKVGKGRQDK